MSDKAIRTKATFLTIERPLLPPPPLESSPYWCYSNTLIFHDAQGNKVWEQEIPEAELYWVENNSGNVGDVFDHYFWPFEVFKDGNFGWQLRMTMSHNRAKFWLAKIMKYMKEHHEKHFLTLKPEEREIERKRD